MCSPVQSWSHPCWTFWSKQNTGISPPRILLAQPLYWCTTILQVLCYLYIIQATMSQALRISQTTPHSWMTMEFHFYGLYWETSVILQVWHYLGHSRPAHQAGNLYPYPWHHHVCSFFMCFPSMVFLLMSSPTETQSLYQTSFDL